MEEGVEDLKSKMSQNMDEMENEFDNQEFDEIDNLINMFQK